MTIAVGFALFFLAELGLGIAMGKWLRYVRRRDGRRPIGHP